MTDGGKIVCGTAYLWLVKCIMNDCYYISMMFECGWLSFVKCKSQMQIAGESVEISWAMWIEIMCNSLESQESNVFLYSDIATECGKEMTKCFKNVPTKWVWNAFTYSSIWYLNTN